MVEPALWRRRHFGSTLSYQGVCGRHKARKIIVVTLGELLLYLFGKDKRPYKENEVGSKAAGVVGQLSSTIGLVKARLSARADIRSVDGEGNW